MKKLFVFFALIFVSSMLFAESPDEMACKFARKVGTVDVWKNYLETYPGGSCAFEAESVLKMNKQATPREMETNNPQDVNACSMARQKNRPDVWRIYLESYPHGVCAFEAKMAISDLEEKARADQERAEREKREIEAKAKAEQERAEREKREIEAKARAERERAEREKAEAERKKSCDNTPRNFPCIDSATRYMWSQQAPMDMAWNEAINYCENLNQGGFSDWHLPNLNLLDTLSGMGVSKLGDTGTFWSSKSDSDTAWFVNFSYGGRGSTGYTGKSLKYSVRCVRW